MFVLVSIEVLKDVPKKEDPDLFTLVTAQATIRITLEKRWLGDYVDYLEQEEGKRKEEERRWEEEKKHRIKRKKELEKAQTKVSLRG